MEDEATGDSAAQLEEARVLKLIKAQETYPTIEQVVDRIAYLERMRAKGEVEKDHASVIVIGLKLDYLRHQQNKFLGIGTPAAVDEEPEQAAAREQADVDAGLAPTAPEAPEAPEEAVADEVPDADQTGDPGADQSGQSDGVPHATLRLDESGLLTGREAGLLEDAGVVVWNDLLVLFQGKDSRKAALESVQGIGRATADIILKKLKDVLPPE